MIVFRLCIKLCYFGTQMPKSPLRWYLHVVQEHIVFICGRCPHASCTGTFQSFPYQIKDSAIHLTSSKMLSSIFISRSRHIIFRTHLQQNQNSTSRSLTLRLLMSYIYIYIYDISSLRINDLTYILLTWRKW